jgi:pimeloyl-ACP methyl ester carboxylesterase
MSSLRIHRWGPELARVLLIHGITSSGATMWRLGEGLADRGAIAPDLLGHGESPRAPRYRAEDFAAGLGSGYELVIGHSLGGLIAAYAAANDPGFAQRLILLDPVLEIADADYDSVVASLVHEAHRPPAEDAIRAENPGWHDECVRAKAIAARQVDPAAVEGTMRDNEPWHHAALLDRVTVPTLILGGDPAIGTTTQPDLGASNPLVSYRMVEGAGHSVHRDRPDVVLAASQCPESEVRAQIAARIVVAGGHR